MKRYILLKDTMTKCGIVCKGTEVICDNSCNSYESYTSNREFKVWFNKDVVENNEEWFELVEEPLEFIKLQKSITQVMDREYISVCFNRNLSEKELKHLEGYIEQFVILENN